MSKTPLEEIHDDHRHMAVLLELLSSDMAALREDLEDAVDLERLRQIMDYFSGYPDRIHHPREETMLEVFLERHAPSEAMKNAWERVRAQHITLPQLTRGVLEMLDAATHDVAVPRERLVERLHDFIVSQREHLVMEEREILPYLEKTMDDEDWLEVNTRMPDSVDPMFGEQIQAEYRELYQLLQNRKT